ncbi:MAG: DUF975 family protein [Syntrophomonas sp.]
MWTRRDIKTRAKAVLKTSYWPAFLVSLIIGIAGGNGSPSFNWNSGSSNFGSSSDVFGNGDMTAFIILAIILSVIGFILLLVMAFRIFLGYPLEIGGRRFFVQAQQDAVDMNHIGFAFNRARYWDIIKSMFWRALMNFLWYLLLIIPGIVMAYAYRMVPYILADNPNIGYKRALQLSTEMTRGHKFSIFVLDLSFIGWMILGVLALFIGVLFVLPYVNATNAELYLVLRQNALEKGLCNKEELAL